MTPDQYQKVKKYSGAAVTIGTIALFAYWILDDFIRGIWP